MPATGITIPPEVVPLIPGNADKWRLLIVAERFQPHQRAAFFAYCMEFVEYLKQQPPFADGDIRQNYQVYACYAKSPTGGLFDSRVESERRIFGDPSRVRDYLERHDDGHPALRPRKNDLVLVLMNLAERGGAGERMNDNIAWTTPVPWLDASGQTLERWPEVALHELGHAFDLDDEYQRAWAGGDDLPVRANIRRHAEIDTQPWPMPFDGPAITKLRSNQRNVGAADPDYPTASEVTTFGSVKVGKFQGARYSKDKFWRSALRCKMRFTRDPFCAVCQSVIRKAILTNPD
jgi:hypothetical protein